MSDQRIAELEAENKWLRQELDRFRGPLMNEAYANLADAESRLAEAQAALQDELQLLATALRDVSVGGVLFEQNPSETNRSRLNRSADYAERVLERFVDEQGDIRPVYLP